MPLILLGWSIFISFNAHLSLDSGISILGLLARWALITVAAWAGLRFRFLRDAKSDSKSYNMYNVSGELFAVLYDADGSLD